MVVVQQRLRLGHRPRRRERGVATDPSQRLDAQVAVDQHQVLVVVHDHHRHLLPDLGHRRDQPAPTIRVADAQLLVPKLELVQVHLHAVTLPDLPRGLHLGLRGPT